MAMPIAVPRYTIPDLYSLPDDGSRYELLNGVLLVTPAPLPAHQIVVERIVGALTHYLHALSSVHVFSPGSVEIEPDVHLEPDILVVPVDQLGAGIPEDTRWSALGAWWLAVEVSGRGSRVYDRDHKGPAYLALGVREVWRADLRDRCLFVSRTGQPDLRQDEQLVWHPPELADPLVLEVPAVFAGITARG